VDDAPADRPEVAHLHVADPARALRIAASAGVDRSARELRPRRERADVQRAVRSSTPRSSSREMSTTTEGRAMRSFITGMSDCPPAIAFASGSPRSSSAWSTSDARS
jgi:hypothetical protein